MGLINSAFDAFRFKDTIFYKENSDLQIRYDALKKLNEEYPNNDEILNQLFIIKKGLKGEDEISYQLKKAHIGMYVLRDVKFKYEDLTAQTDYIVITPVYTYFIECKNLVGNITVTDKGDFIREFSINGKKIKKAIYSPLRQVEAQREVIRKIWETKVSKLAKLFASNKFDYYRKVLVIVANPETILNTDKAPKDIKYKVLRADGLVRQIEYDLNHMDNNEYIDSKKIMKELAQFYIDISFNEEINYYEYYKEKYCKDNKSSFDNNLKNRLVRLRKDRASEMHLPAYYIFTNDELDKLIKIKPKTLEELKKANIIAPIKIKTHGEAIIEEINKTTFIK